LIYGGAFPVCSASTAGFKFTDKIFFAFNLRVTERRPYILIWGTQCIEPCAFAHSAMLRSLSAQVYYPQTPDYPPELITHLSFAVVPAYNILTCKRLVFYRTYVFAVI